MRGSEVTRHAACLVVDPFAERLADQNVDESIAVDVSRARHLATEFCTALRRLRGPVRCERWSRRSPEVELRTVILRYADQNVGEAIAVHVSGRCHGQPQLVVQMALDSPKRS